MKGLRRGRVELVTMPSPGIEPLSTLIRAFTRRHPGITVDAEAAFTADEVIHQVRQGACELGLAGAPGPLRPPGVDVLPLQEQDFVLVGAADAAFPDGDPLPIGGLAGVELIASPPGSLMRQVVDDILAEHADVRIIAEVAHRASILPLVLQGAGLAVLPAAWASLARRSGARAVRLDHPARLHVALLSRQAPLTPAAQAFLALARTFRSHEEGPDQAE